MEPANDLLTGRTPAYTEERSGKYLIIWSDIPNWMVVDEEAFQFLKEIEGPHTREEIRQKYQSISKSSDEEMMEAIINTFVNAYILYPVADEPPRFFVPGGKLKSVVIHPTNRCNLRCIMCYNKDILLSPHESIEELTAEEFTDFLDQVVPYLEEKDTDLQILGGEPLIVPEKSLKIAEYGCEIMGAATLSTNGTLITKDFAQKAASIEDLVVQVSLDSPYKKTHEAIRGKGTYAKAIRGIKTLVKEGATTVMSMTCNKKSVSELEQYYTLALQMGVTSARFIPFQEAGGGINCSLEMPYLPFLVKESFDMFRQNHHFWKMMSSDFLSTVARSCRTCGVQKWCGAGLRLVLLDPYGDVYPCPNHYLPEFKAGNIRQEPFQKIWEDSPVLKNLRKIYPVEVLNEQCATCYVRHWCAGWCRGATYQITEKMTNPSVQCEEIKEMIVDMFFRLSDDQGVFGKLTKNFRKPLSMNQL